MTIMLLAALLLTFPHGLVHEVARRGARIVCASAGASSRSRSSAMLTAANAASIYLLVHVLVNGGTVVASPLLRAAVHLWCVNVLVFALGFWQLDGGGPVKRRTLDIRAIATSTSRSRPTRRSSARAWQPTFIDYLYVSYTNSAAFSPTDTMPLSRWAKMLMLVAVRGEPDARPDGRRARRQHPPLVLRRPRPSRSRVSRPRALARVLPSGVRSARPRGAARSSTASAARRSTTSAFRRRLRLDRAAAGARDAGVRAVRARAASRRVRSRDAGGRRRRTCRRGRGRGGGATRAAPLAAVSRRTTTRRSSSIRTGSGSRWRRRGTPGSRASRRRLSAQAAGFGT